MNFFSRYQQDNDHETGRRWYSFHEAGHAVAFAVLGGLDVVATLEPPLASCTPTWMTARDRVLATLAGQAAMERTEPARFDMALRIANPDRRDAERMLTQLGEVGDFDRYLDQARAFVRQHLGAISRVAAILRERGEIHDAELRHVIGLPPAELPPPPSGLQYGRPLPLEYL